MTGCFLQRRGGGVHVQETEKWLRFVLRNVVGSPESLQQPGVYANIVPVINPVCIQNVRLLDTEEKWSWERNFRRKGYSPMRTWMTMVLVR